MKNNLEEILDSLFTIYVGEGEDFGILNQDKFMLIKNDVFDKIKIKKNPNQIDNCLSYDELCNLFQTRFNHDINNLYNISNRIDHIKKCPECSGWIKFGYSIYEYICNNRLPLKSFFEELEDHYKKHIQNTELCKKYGHVFGDINKTGGCEFASWVYREWPSENEPGNTEHEWTRRCSRCGLIERTTEEPDCLKKSRKF